MKQILYAIWICCMSIMFLTACSNENEPLCNEEVTSGNAITMKLSTGIQFETRADIINAEVAVTHLDVFIFNEQGDNKYYERVSNCTNNEGTITLKASKNQFSVNEQYWVYLIANSTHTTEDFKELKSLNDLKSKTQEDERVHITGLALDLAPKAFLMDGIAYANEQEPQTATSVTLNDGNSSLNTELKVMLRRAAAKIIIHIKEGDKVTFDKNMEGASPDYYIQNLPYSTSLLAGIGNTAKLRNSYKTNTSYYEWSTDEGTNKNAITLTAYAYSHNWNNISAFQNEVRMVVNIPMKYNNGSTQSNHLTSYYQIPVCEQKILERNTCYEVTVTVNAPGAEDISEPIKLDPISYTVEKWNDIPVEVGGNIDHPVYLYVNEEQMEMYNIESDNTTLEFASSSPVKTEITRVYYIDKFGQEQDLEKHEDGNNNYAQKTSSYYEQWKNQCRIVITPDENINGKISIESSIPENKTIRYIELNVTNSENITRKVIIAQYPLEYITNIKGWYSYRDDFKKNDSSPTTYTYKGDRIVGISFNQDYNSYSYKYNTTSSGFWRSKVARSFNNNGKADIDYYTWSNNGNQPSHNDAETGNARMYHVRIIASSGKYTVGKPRLTQEGYTDPGMDNAQLVSPSFMIASRLGFVNTGYGGIDLSENNKYALEVVRNHCLNYVEVYKDANDQPVILNDWRLPTTAELNIIMDFQGTQNENADAIDYLLNAEYYWSANERVINNKYTSSGTSIRCIRDAYQTE